MPLHRSSKSKKAGRLIFSPPLVSPFADIQTTLPMAVCLGCREVTHRETQPGKMVLQALDS